MPLQKRNVSGFEFVKIGTFQIAEEPHNFRYKSKDEKIYVTLKLVDDSFKHADESAYLVCVNNVPHYVGEFSYNLSDRWLKNGDYIWHNIDDVIDGELRKGNEISMWITVNPFLTTSENKEINISKSIEQEILRQKKPIGSVKNLSLFFWQCPGID